VPRRDLLVNVGMSESTVPLGSSKNAVAMQDQVPEKTRDQILVTADRGPELEHFKPDFLPARSSHHPPDPLGQVALEPRTSTLALTLPSC
jgi:hypothetical protein